MKPITIETMNEYRFLSDALLSPDGAQAALLVHRCNEAGDGYDSDLWLAAPGGARRLTASADAGCFCWCDERTLLFASKRGKVPEGSTAFYTIRTDGGEAVPAFTIPRKVSRIEPLGGGLWAVCALWDNGEPEEHGDCDVFDELPFWFNGQGIVNKKRRRLYRYDASSGTLGALTPPLYQTDGWTVSEDRSKIVCWGLEYADLYEERQDVREYDIAQGTQRVLLESGQYEISHADFYHGGWLLLATDGKRYGINENYMLYTLDAQGNMSLLCGEDLSYGSTVGSDCRYGGGSEFAVRDGEIIFTVTDRACSRLCRLGADGKPEYLTRAAGSVDCFDVRAGRTVFVAMRGMGLQELYELGPDGAETPLTALNAGILREYEIAEPKALTFTARDGLEIDGWVLMPPQSAAPGTRPAILDVHGGPKTVYGPVFFHEMQVWAAMGYVVLFCNPRGGDGRGNAFADIRGHYGDGDYRDVMEFVDRVLEAVPQIDEKRMGITGGSYGGFMTNWVIGHTQRFAAAASQRSIANWSTMEGVSDIGRSFECDQMGASTWDGFDRLWEQSPLRYADRVKTPTLFIHSREDYRCPENEGIQMFAAIKRFGVPARLCLFHGENHELSRSGMPRRRVRRLREITDWFERYLKN